MHRHVRANSPALCSFNRLALVAAVVIRVNDRQGPTPGCACGLQMSLLLPLPICGCKTRHSRVTTQQCFCPLAIGHLACAVSHVRASSLVLCLVIGWALVVCCGFLRSTAAKDPPPGCVCGCRCLCCFHLTPVGARPVTTSVTTQQCLCPLSTDT
jgi:hypothetical protein